MYWHWLWWLIDVAVPEGKRTLTADHEVGENISTIRFKGWYTCTYCIRQGICEYAFDLYSTNGDCLWEK